MSTGFGNCVMRRISKYRKPQTPKLYKLMSVNSEKRKNLPKSWKTGTT